MKDLERVLISVERELKRKGGRLGRKFIICEGIYENDGMMLELPRVVSSHFPLVSYFLWAGIVARSMAATVLG